MVRQMVRVSYSLIRSEFYGKFCSSIKALWHLPKEPQLCLNSIFYFEFPSNILFSFHFIAFRCPIGLRRDNIFCSPTRWKTESLFLSGFHRRGDVFLRLHWLRHNSHHRRGGDKSEEEYSPRHSLVVDHNSHRLRH